MGSGSIPTLMPLEFLEVIADRFRILAHPHRLRIVELLSLEGEAPVHRILACIGLPQASTSQHLTRMRRAGLIASERRGREVWYRLSDPSCSTILDCIRTKEAQS